MLTCSDSFTGRFVTHTEICFSDSTMTKLQIVVLMLVLFVLPLCAAKQKVPFTKKAAAEVRLLCALHVSLYVLHKNHTFLCPK